MSNAFDAPQDTSFCGFHFGLRGFRRELPAYGTVFDWRMTAFGDHVKGECQGAYLTTRLEPIECEIEVVDREWERFRCFRYRSAEGDICHGALCAACGRMTTVELGTGARCACECLYCSASVSTGKCRLHHAYGGCDLCLGETAPLQPSRYVQRAADSWYNARACPVRMKTPQTEPASPASQVSREDLVDAGLTKD